MNQKGTFLKFVPFVSSMDPGFWYKLRDFKLNELGLNDQHLYFNASYCNYTADRVQACINIDYDALDPKASFKSKFYWIKGKLKITNNLEALTGLDRNACLKEEGEKLWESLKDEGIFKDPSALLFYSLFTYLDLKRFKFYYSALHASLMTPQKFLLLKPVLNLSHRFNPQQIESLMVSYDEYVENTLKANHPPPHVFLLREGQDGCLGVEEFCGLKDVRVDEGNGGKVMVGVCDASSLPTSPAWPLRNLLYAIAYHCYTALKGEVEVLCWRERTRSGERYVGHSIVLNLALPQVTSQSSCPEATGWEKLDGGVKVVDLSASMDPLKLSESAVDLNLKLMKWRLAPDLQLDTIASTSCLLLGAGTLGCNVARCLLGWGVRNITLVDNSRVSFSNPVRQSLFTFKHCLEGGVSKAIAAAEALKEIFPHVNAVGVELDIPMPGHFVTERTQDRVKQEVDRLVGLIQDHDVVMLLMDTRESRWLPSLLARIHGKIVMSVALGFDTYLVIRHATGFPDEEKEEDGHGVGHGNDDKDGGDNNKKKNGGNNNNKKNEVIKGDNLGCYFCNDVTSPGNSTTERSMDQQCTVTRPGVSMVAASLAVEVLVSLLNHPFKGKAGAVLRRKASDAFDIEESTLGIIPHQIRGFLSRYDSILPTCPCFHHCIACSSLIAEEYKRGGFCFLLKVFNSPNVLEDLSGLTALHQQVDAQEIIDFPGDSD